MSELSNNLFCRRVELGYSVPQVHKALGLIGVTVAESTVAAWFNGGRRPQDMQHLKALCKVLRTTISEMAGEDPEFAKNSLESALLAESREIDPSQLEAVLAIMRTMRPKRTT